MYVTKQYLLLGPNLIQQRSLIFVSLWLQHQACPSIWKSLSLSLYIIRKSAKYDICTNPLLKVVSSTFINIFLETETVISWTPDRSLKAEECSDAASRLPLRKLKIAGSVLFWLSWIIAKLEQLSFQYIHSLTMSLSIITALALKYLKKIILEKYIFKNV